MAVPHAACFNSGVRRSLHAWMYRLD